MKKAVFFFISFLTLLTACEDVVEVQVPEEDPRLIVDAIIRVDTTERFLPIRVKVTETNSFFEEIPVTELESIILFADEIEDGSFLSTGDAILTEEAPGTGIYITDSVYTDERVPTAAVFNENIQFSLIIRHKGKKYIAQTRYVPAVPIESLEQGTATLFEGDETEVLVTFTDDPERDNYYLFDFDFNEFLVTEDEFYQGQEFQFSYFYDQEFDPGTEIEISIMGADQQFYNYMNLILEQTEQNLGFFETPKATVRGNVFDITDLDNIEVFDNVEQPDTFPLGYFAIVQEFKDTLTIQ